MLTINDLLTRMNLSAGHLYVEKNKVDAVGCKKFCADCAVTVTSPSVTKLSDYSTEM